jgi:hypothetical protein
MAQLAKARQSGLVRWEDDGLLANRCLQGLTDVGEPVGLGTAGDGDLAVEEAELLQTGRGDVLARVVRQTLVAPARMTSRGRRRQQSVR